MRPKSPEIRHFRACVDRNGAIAGGRFRLLTEKSALPEGVPAGVDSKAGQWHSASTGHAMTVAVGDGRGFSSLAAAPDGWAPARCTARCWPGAALHFFGSKPEDDDRGGSVAGRGRYLRMRSRTTARRLSRPKACRAFAAWAFHRSSSSSCPCAGQRPAQVSAMRRPCQVCVPVPFGARGSMRTCSARALQPMAVEHVEDGAVFGRRDLVDAAVAVGAEELAELAVD